MPSSGLVLPVEETGPAEKKVEDGVAVLCAGWALKEVGTVFTRWRRRFCLVRTATEEERAAVDGTTHLLLVYKSDASMATARPVAALPLFRDCTTAVETFKRVNRRTQRCVLIRSPQGHPVCLLPGKAPARNKGLFVLTLNADLNLATVAHDGIASSPTTEIRDWIRIITNLEPPADASELRRSTIGNGRVVPQQLGEESDLGPEDVGMDEPGVSQGTDDHMEHDNGTQWRGVSCEFLRWLDTSLRCHDFGKPYSSVTTKEVCAQFIVPACRGGRGAYVDVARNVVPAEKTGGSPWISGATAFVSHAWSYCFEDVLAQLIRKGEENATLYFWLDVLMIDQVNAPKLEKDFWQSTFKAAIADVGHTILVMSPW